MSKLILKSCLEIYRGVNICEAAFVDMFGADFGFTGRSVVTGNICSEPQDSIRAIDFIYLEVKPLIQDAKLELYGKAWALVYLKEFHEMKQPENGIMSASGGMLRGFAISHGQLIPADTYWLVKNHRELTISVIMQYQTMLDTIISLLNNLQPPPGRRCMNRHQVITMLDSTLQQLR